MRIPVRSTLVIIPTYDERENLPMIVDRALTATSDDVHLLVVDDHSPDGTGDVAEQLAMYRPRVHVLHRGAKHGLGPAYLAGFGWAVEQGFDAVVEMDADGSHAPEDLTRLIAGLATSDFVLGSRWVAGGNVEDWPVRRQLLSRAGNRYARVALGIDVQDATGGFRAIRTDALQRIPLGGVASEGYCFQVDLLWKALLAGLAVVEVPIVFTERTSGRSKMSSRIVLEALLRVTEWGMARRFEQAGELLLHGRRLPSVRSGSTHAA
jgi:dolichol-phosphate mannosyltransferase